MPDPNYKRTDHFEEAIPSPQSTSGRKFHTRCRFAMLSQTDLLILAKSAWAFGVCHLYNTRTLIEESSEKAS